MLRRETQLKQCHVRIKKREPLDEETEKPRMKILRNEQQKRQEKLRRGEVIVSLKWIHT